MLKQFEFDVNLKLGALVYKYYQELVVRAKAISAVSVDETMQNQAFDRLEILKDTTNNTIQEIQKKRNRYTISIQSPIIVLPIFGTYEGK
jgi:hypothetical protein